MATPNNITQNWKSVLDTAKAELAATTQQIDNLVATQGIPLSNQKRQAVEQIAAAKAAIANAINNKQDPTKFEAALTYATNQLNTVQPKLTAVNSQIDQLTVKEGSLQAQIVEATNQIATQATGTTSATNNTLAATTAPASAAPVNPNIAALPPVTIPPGDVTTKPADLTTKTNPGQLPLGDEIDDIYSHDLTQAQINSLSPGDIKARNAYLASEAAGTLDTEGAATAQDEIIVNGYPPNDAATAQDLANFEAYEDWRVRLALGPGASYLYMGDDPGILSPLRETRGVVFPYTPNVQVNYAASYDQTQLVHSNYKVNQYTGSSVDTVSISCDFTAQDVYEAQYLLAVIHFFRTCTKMFYGQDTFPVAGTPPPLCYMYGMGSFQFSAHPLAIVGFNYNLPNDVDYIKTTGPATYAGEFDPAQSTSVDIGPNDSLCRLGPGISRGGQIPPPQFFNPAAVATTWVPTKINLTIQCYPMMSRNAVSNKFALGTYGSGVLLDGVTQNQGGFW